MFFELDIALTMIVILQKLALLGYETVIPRKAVENITLKHDVFMCFVSG